jgi:hypothetical protein
MQLPMDLTTDPKVLTAAVAAKLRFHAHVPRQKSEVQRYLSEIIAQDVRKKRENFSSLITVFSST